MTRRPLAAGASAAALAATAWLATAGPDQPVELVERRDLVLTAEAEGVLEALESVTISPPPVSEMWNFKITFLAPEGSLVEQGAPVVRFDSSDLERRLAEVRAERDRAEAQLDKRSTDLEVLEREIELRLAEAQAKLRRSELELAVPAELVANRDLETARLDRALALREIAATELEIAHRRAGATAELAGLRASRDQAAARVEQLEQDIARLTVAAPRSGTVVYLAVRGGEKPKVSDTVWRAAKLVELPSLDRMHAVGEVDEADLGRLALGQPVTLTLDAHRDLQLRGRVTEIRRSVQARSARDPRRIVRVEIALEAVDTDRLRPGMRWQGQIETERITGVATIPLGAVEITPDGPTLRVPGWPRPRRRVLELGRRDSQWLEVTAGLAVGDRFLAGSRSP